MIIYLPVMFFQILRAQLHYLKAVDLNYERGFQMLTLNLYCRGSKSFSKTFLPSANISRIKESANVTPRIQTMKQEEFYQRDV